MSLKMYDLSREQVEKLTIDYGMKPSFTGQQYYIASGPGHEILVTHTADDVYEVELLDKIEMEKTLLKTIQMFKEYSATPRL